MAVNLAPDLTSRGSQKTYRVGPDDISPATFLGLFCSLALNAFFNILGSLIF